MVDQTEQQEDGLLSAEAKPFLPQKAPAGGIPATIQEDGQQEEYTTPVVSRKQSRDVPNPHSAKLTPKIGAPTRLLIESLDRIPFTPSQGICTPSPNNMAAMMVHHHHHHHHVYGNGTQQPGDQEINDAFMAGVAAGRADVMERTGNQTLIPAVYDSPTRQLPLHTAGMHQAHGQGPKQDVRFANNISNNNDDDDDDDANSIVGRTHGEKKAWVGNGIDEDEARQVAIEICAVEGMQLTRECDIPGELIALGSLMLTLGIAPQFAMCPAHEFASPKKGATHNPLSIKLNARQRRTLRRAQERASKALEALRSELKSPNNAPAPQVYSPTCMAYGVNPHAYADYNFIVMHQSSGIPPSPTHASGFGYQHAMAPHPGRVLHHHQQPGQPRMMSRFAQQQEYNYSGNKGHF